MRRFNSPLFNKSRLTKSSQMDCPYSFNSLSGLAIVLLLARELRLGGRVDVLSGEPEFHQQFLQRRRRAERFHRDDRAAQSGEALPAERRRLLDRDAPRAG